MTSSERQPTLVTLSDGFLFVYEVIAPNGNSDIVVRKFGPTGNPIGAAIQANIEDLTTPSDDRRPALAVKADGSFAVVWNSVGLAGGVNPPGPPRAMARLFSKTLAPAGNPFPLNTSLLGSDHDPRACWDTTGRLIVGFKTIDEVRPFQASLKGVSIRRVAAGKVQGAELKVALPALRSTSFALACVANGGFRVVWESELTPAGFDGDLVYANFDKAAKRVGAVARLNSILADGQTNPALVVDTAGNWIVVWESDAGVNRAIRGRRFLANGKPDGADFLVAQKSAITSPLRYPVVALTGPGTFVVLWDDHAKNVMTRRFTFR